ncbi:MAG: A/G-specific adenine glycosylase [Treponemataceae bacterium]
MKQPEILEFQKTILDFYYQNPREFAWRETTDPYEILVSEIMLQQTQTDRVVQKYQQWLSLFPTIEVLANATLSDVLCAWSGLGYNRRGRFLLECAKALHKDYNSCVPDDYKTLLSLPGIGTYTAKAVLTFAFNRPEVFIETNIRSVYLFFFFNASKEAVSDAMLMPIIEQTVYSENPRIWYYALMDYGAKLKKVIPNPNRKSRHYAKQSQFEGSLRQARGAIIRQLTQASSKYLDFAFIAEQEKIDIERLQRAGESLIAEGLIQQEGALYRINTSL